MIERPANAELLPCPLCNSPASGPRKYGHAEWDGARSIECNNSECKLFLYRSNRFETREQTDANLVARWNRRTQSESGVMEALKLAKSHIEHMAKWIAAQKGGYSFESLGEDMPVITAALAAQEKAE